MTKILGYDTMAKFNRNDFKKLTKNNQVPAFIGRYVGRDWWRCMDLSERFDISANELRIAPMFYNGIKSKNVKYFTEEQSKKDYDIVHSQIERLYLKGACCYFFVNFEPKAYDFPEILQYFSELIFRSEQDKMFSIGAYGSGALL